MTINSAFSAEELDLLIRLPRWVVAASSVAQRDNAFRTKIEVEQGFVAVADGRQLGNAFVSEAANLAMDQYDHAMTAYGISFDNPDEGTEAVLERARAAVAVLNAKADHPDAAAYREWLGDICDTVVRAVRSGDVLGFGGTLVTESEHRFQDRLAAILSA